MAFVLALITPRLPDLARLATDGIVNLRLPAQLIPAIVQTSIQGVFTLAAGLWVIRKKPFADMPPRIHFVAFLTLAAVAVSCALHDAWIVGALTYPPAVRYPVDAMHIASGAYLALLLWRSNSPSGRTPFQRTGVLT